MTKFEGLIKKWKRFADTHKHYRHLINLGTIDQTYMECANDLKAILEGMKKEDDVALIPDEICWSCKKIKTKEITVVQGHYIIQPNILVSMCPRCQKKEKKEKDRKNRKDEK